MTYIKKGALIKLVDDSAVKKFKTLGFEIYTPENSGKKSKKTVSDKESEAIPKAGEDDVKDSE